MVASTILIVAASGARAEDKPKSIWEQDTLTGDWGGARTALNDRGIDFTISYIGETLASSLAASSGGRSSRGG